PGLGEGGVELARHLVELAGGGVGRVGGDDHPGAGEDEGIDPVVPEDRAAILAQGGQGGVGGDLRPQGLEAGARVVEVRVQGLAVLGGDLLVGGQCRLGGRQGGEAAVGG